MVSEIDFFKILYKIVAGWKPTVNPSLQVEERFKRINTFAVLHEDAQMYSQNLGRDSRYKPSENPDLFFSRIWEENAYVDEMLLKEYPALMAWELPGSLDLRGLSVKRETVRLRLYLQDQHQAKYSPGSYEPTRGGQRPLELIKDNLRTLFNQLFSELDLWVRADVNYTAGGSGQVWINKNDLAVNPLFSSYGNQVKISAFVRLSQETDMLSGLGDGDTVTAYRNLELSVDPCVSLPEIDHSFVPASESPDHHSSA